MPTNQCLEIFFPFFFFLNPFWTSERNLCHLVLLQSAVIMKWLIWSLVSFSAELWPCQSFAACCSILLPYCSYRKETLTVHWRILLKGCRVFNFVVVSFGKMNPYWMADISIRNILQLWEVLCWAWINPVQMRVCSSKRAVSSCMRMDRWIIHIQRHSELIF